MGDPAFEIERERSVGQDPLAVKFTCNMHVGTGDMAAFAGWISHRLTGLHFSAKRGFGIRRQV